MSTRVTRGYMRDPLAAILSSLRGSSQWTSVLSKTRTSLLLYFPMAVDEAGHPDPLRED